jgi:Ribosomal protein S21
MLSLSPLVVVQLQGIGSSLIIDIGQVRWAHVRRVCARAQVSPNALGEQLEPMPIVHYNNIDQALRVLKKKMQPEGMFREMKRRFQ